MAFLLMLCSMCAGYLTIDAVEVGKHAVFSDLSPTSLGRPGGSHYLNATNCGSGGLRLMRSRTPALTKPTVFFSHSSKDKTTVGALKGMFAKKTAGTVDLFVSSDGQSIPFGRNWVSEVEDALGRCKVMFLCLTSDSISSPWVHFEAGHAYAKQVRVVPVALPGVDVGRLPPPLGLLQGFNVTSHAGLNNMIKVVNDVTGHAHELSFDEDEFAKLFNGTGAESSLGQYAPLIDELRMMPDKNSSRSLQELERWLKERQVECTVTDLGVAFRGVEVRVFDQEWTAFVDPASDSETLDTAFELIRYAAGGGVYVELLFRPGVKHEGRVHICSNRLHRDSVRGGQLFGRDSALSWRELTFLLRDPTKNDHGDWCLVVTTSSESFPAADLAQLLEVLFKRKLLWEV